MGRLTEARKKALRKAGRKLIAKGGRWAKAGRALLRKLRGK